MSYRHLKEDFFARPCLVVSQELVGKVLCRRTESGEIRRLRITETEAYCGENDTACHAHKGRTARTEVFYGPAGTLYIYLCYGIHWMLNIVTGDVGDPQAVLIRACENAEGPGRLTKALGIDKRYNAVSLSQCEETFWLEDDGLAFEVVAAPRVGIGYASPEDQERPWRFILKR